MIDVGRGGVYARGVSARRVDLSDGLVESHRPSAENPHGFLHPEKIFVGKGGLEPPPRFTGLAPKASAYANSATYPFLNFSGRV